MARFLVSAAGYPEFSDAKGSGYNHIKLTGLKGSGSGVYSCLLIQGFRLRLGKSGLLPHTLNVV